MIDFDQADLSPCGTLVSPVRFYDSHGKLFWTAWGYLSCSHFHRLRPRSTSLSLYSFVRSATANMAPSEVSASHIPFETSTITPPMHTDSSSSSCPTRQSVTAKAWKIGAFGA